MKQPSLRNIQKLHRAEYGIDVELRDVDSYLQRYAQRQAEFGYKFELCPDFQRGHVWTKLQQSNYIEWLLKDGESGRDIFFNHPGWQSNYKGDMVCVDGLQRLTAVSKFCNNEVPAFGYLISEYDQKSLSILNSNSLRFRVGTLQTREQVLEWYLQFNSGGTVHSESELSRVRALLEAERQK